MDLVTTKERPTTQIVKDVPLWFKNALLTIGGRNFFNEPNLKAELDVETFSEPLWVIKEWWKGETFGTREDWEKVIEIDGELFDAGEYPSRGLYVTVLVWANEKGEFLDLNSDLLDRLSFQRQQREIKNVSYDDVMMQVIKRQNQIQAQQEKRINDQILETSEYLNTNLEKILTNKTREYSKNL